MDTNHQDALVELESDLRVNLSLVGIVPLLEKVLTFHLLPYDTPCSVPVNGPKFHVNRPHVMGGVFKQKILAYVFLHITATMNL